MRLEMVAVAKVETNRSAILRRLESEGWLNEGGAKHDLFRRRDTPFVIIVPRHRELSPGVARSIAKAAGW